MSRDVSRRSPAGTQDGDDTADGNGGGARLAHTRRALLRGVGAATAAGGALSTGTKRGVTTLTPVGVAGAESTPETAWTRTYGADDDREAWDVVERPDGDYLVVGRRAPSDGEPPAGWVATVDPAGTIQWERSLSEFELTQFMTVLQRSDGDFLVGGLVSPADVDSTGALVATLSRSGDVRWRWITDDFEEGRVLSAVERTDGDYLLAGSVSPSGGDAQLWLTTIGPTGERRWTRIYGGTGLDGGLTVLETGEGNYLVGGTKTPERGGDGSPWLLSVDGTGAVRWERTYGDREGPGLVASAVETDDGEFLVCGSTYVPDRDDSEGWLARVGPGGDVRWQRTFGDRGLWRLWSLATTGDGSFAVLGFNGDAATNPDAARLLGFDGAGAVEWDWSADSSAETGGFGLTATGGDYLLAGYRNESEGGNSDGWLVRLSPPTANATESPVGDDRPSDVDETPPAADTDDSERVEGEIDGDGNGGDGGSVMPALGVGGALAVLGGGYLWFRSSGDDGGTATARTTRGGGTGDASESPVTGASTAPPDRNSGRDTRGTAPHPGPDSDAVTTGRTDAGRERDTNERTTADTSASHTDPAGDRSSATPSAEAATTEGRTDSSADEPTPAAAGDADDPTSVPVADLDPDDVSALLDRMEAGDGLERTADRLEAVAAERPELLDHTDAVDRLRDLRLDPDPAVSRAATEALDGVADDGR